MSTFIGDIPLKAIDGTATSLGAFHGNVLLVVNVASRCGLTPQYAGLEGLYQTYRDRGFSVLAFPANDFGAQEPGSNEEIAAFCRTAYDVTFPVFEKIAVTGDGMHPLYEALIAAQPQAPGAGSGSDITWNFEKFLLSRTGEPVARFAPSVTPDDPVLVDAIEREIRR